MTSSSTTNLGSGNMNLPQMRSIWLDEDEEAEKLYGLQAQQFMGSDDEENLGITFINSDKPVLSNKQNIELPPLLPNTHSSRYDGRSTSNSAVSIETSSSSSTIKTKHKKVLFKLNLLKKRFLGTQLDIRAKNISTPFDFQHISHADTKNGFQDEQLQGPLSAPTEIEEDSALSLSKRDSRSLNKAFVTERIPANRESKLIPRSHDKKTSRLSVARSISVTSSNYSKSTQGNNHSINGRVVSTSTMATSIFEYSPNSSPKQSKTKSHNVSHRYTGSTDSSESSLDFLKNYNFPTLLEDKPILDFLPRSQRSSAYRSLLGTPNSNKSSTKVFASPQQSPVIKRRNSVSTASPQSKFSYVDSPANFRKSFDDIIHSCKQLEPLQV
ncbi:hypothetical protein SKDZ_04G5090 [Saccharomyces kudriavzevii ZP591]|uniref:Gic2p n=1 Tax=Saccharomyces cerevisiae x Saccharomyces kudriavzevii (strain VIN7) TaxID=1095631 RepID=H0GT48_SACCK|nr:Gic2p [Saccharomyces cerevisiae x Saccharomyces kudriavzevii VIN7]CAI4058821.1 hypothetical protein SKDZ_04G5090 [Saccharomyces kudriavzevii ZP591]